jgi:hypothetical protein
MSDFLKSLLLPESTPGSSKVGLADFLYRGGGDVTMRSRLDNTLIQAIWEARQMAAMFGDTDMVEATGLLMELWVSHQGEGRKEGVAVHQSVYQTNFNSPQVGSSVDKDPALDG